MDANPMQIAKIVRKLLAVPDKLVTAQLYLRPISHGDPIATSTENIEPIADACDLVHSALGDIVEAARELADLSSVDRGAPAFRCVSVDSYYRRE
jgi:hypothetical protein